jgi:hypothetical protein
MRAEAPRFVKVRRRPALRGGLAVALALCAGCDRSPFDAERTLAPPEPTDPEPTAARARRGGPVDMEGGISLERTDPTPPAGDLREDVARFTTLDTCVAQHAVLDPLVGDAVRSIGYDTLLRDACRVLQAIKLKDPSPCSAITASGLQHRCELLVAIALQEPDRCPWSVATQKRLGRDATCLAVSTHDPRSCAAELETLQPTCEALASGDPSRCGRANGDERSTCSRDVERLHALLADEHDKHDTTQPQAHVEIHGANGTSDPPVTEVDLSSAVAGGAVVAADPVLGAGIELARDTEGVLGLPLRAERAHLTASVAFEGGAPRLVKLVVAAPRLPEISCPSPHCSIAVTMPKSDPKRGAPLVATFDGVVESPSGTFRVHLQIDSFVRDVVGRAALYGGR